MIMNGSYNRIQHCNDIGAIYWNDDPVLIYIRIIIPPDLENSRKISRKKRSMKIEFFS